MPFLSSICSRPFHSISFIHSPFLILYVPAIFFFCWIFATVLVMAMVAFALKAEKISGVVWGYNGADRRRSLLSAFHCMKRACVRDMALSVIQHTARGQSQSASFVRGLSTDIQSVIFFPLLLSPLNSLLNSSYISRGTTSLQAQWFASLNNASFGHLDTETALTMAPYQ